MGPRESRLYTPNDTGSLKERLSFWWMCTKAFAVGAPVAALLVAVIVKLVGVFKTFTSESSAYETFTDILGGLCVLAFIAFLIGGSILFITMLGCIVMDKIEALFKRRKTDEG